ncbi:hypothetical protein VTK56DRAFT_2725 [Thermocarpiscus australiensis]
MLIADSVTKVPNHNKLDEHGSRIFLNPSNSYVRIPSLLHMALPLSLPIKLGHRAGIRPSQIHPLDNARGGFQLFTWEERVERAGGVLNGTVGVPTEGPLRVTPGAASGLRVLQFNKAESVGNNGTILSRYHPGRAELLLCFQSAVLRMRGNTPAVDRHFALHTRSC